MSQNLTRFWGKLGTASTSNGYHPLICHMADVAAVARAIWTSSLSPAGRVAIMHSLGMRDESAAAIWVSFLAGVHDLGKACPVFQRSPSARELTPFFADLPTPLGRKSSDAPHGTVTALALPALLARHGMNRELGQHLGVITGGHHGLFPRIIEREEVRRRGGAGTNPWSEAREQLLEALANVVGVPWEEAPTSIDPSGVMQIAGLVSVADWIGSDRKHFPYAADTRDAAPDLSLDSYWDNAVGQARDALQNLGWLGWTPPSSRRSFRQLFSGTIAEPNDLQVATERLMAQLADQSALLIIEAPMGEGKTEAAFYAADAWGVAPGPRGMYVALPTQASSNEMLTRLKEFLGKRYPDDAVNLMLLHGQAALSVEFEQLLDPQPSPDDSSKPQTTGEARVRAAAWFTKRKRGLLAPFGVGTVDQALLATLQTRHVFVRLFGLANKVVVVDEVHAYDTYMTTLLETMLKWLGALRSPVVLLSATLPAARRNALLDAYAQGAGLTLESGQAAPYPRLTWLPVPASDSTRSTAMGSLHVNASSRAQRTLPIRWIDGALAETGHDTFSLGKNLREALAAGGCAAVICTTVGRAQQMYEALKQHFPGIASDGDPELDLLHSHFLYDNRQEREARSRRRFGKPGPSSRRPFRAVLVSTQIIEQSLDLDFDLIVSDFAPIDLLLQRSGRLHRHLRGVNERERPPGLRTPELWLCRPPEEAECPSFPIDKYVYDEHILLRTWVELKSRTQESFINVSMPDEIDDLVNSVYSDQPAPPAGLSPEALTFWHKSGSALAQQLFELRRLAESKEIYGPDMGVDELLDDWNMELEEEEPEVHPHLQALTRVEERPSVPAVFLMPDDLSLLAFPTTNKKTVRALLGRSVRLSGQLARLIDRVLVPPSWQNSPLLRHHKLIELGADGTSPQTRLRLSPELGVVVK